MKTWSTHLKILNRRTQGLLLHKWRGFLSSCSATGKALTASQSLLNQATENIALTSPTMAFLTTIFSKNKRLRLRDDISD